MQIQYNKLKMIDGTGSGTQPPQTPPCHSLTRLSPPAPNIKTHINCNYSAVSLQPWAPSHTQGTHTHRQTQLGSKV